MCGLVESQQRERVKMYVAHYIAATPVCVVPIRDLVESQQRVRVCSSIWDLG